MAGYTQHYGLHQWEPGDPFLRTDFNGDFEKIDTAIKGVEKEAEAKKADKSALAALEARVDGKAAIVTGTYTGNGSTLTVELGFRPRAVLVPISARYMAAAIGGQDTAVLTLTGGGFTVSLGGDGVISPNRSGSVYYYLAFR